MNVVLSRKDPEKVCYENLTTNPNFDKYDIRYIIIQVTDRMLISVKPVNETVAVKLPALKGGELQFSAVGRKGKIM